MLQLFYHHHTAAAGDNEAVAIGVIGAGSFFRRFVIFGGQCAHRIKLAGHFPAQLFAAAGKHNVLFAQLDLLYRITDTVCGGGAGGADGVVNAVDFKRCRQAGGNAGGHGFGDHVRADGFQAARAAHRIGAEHLEARGTAAGTGNQANARVILVLFFLQAGRVNRFLHGQVRINGSIAHKAYNFTIDQAGSVQFNIAPYVTTHAGIF